MKLPGLTTGKGPPAGGTVGTEKTLGCQGGVAGGRESGTEQKETEEDQQREHLNSGHRRGKQWVQAEKWLWELPKPCEPQWAGKMKGCWDGEVHVHGTIVQRVDTWMIEKRKTSDKGETQREQAQGEIRPGLLAGLEQAGPPRQVGGDVIGGPREGGTRRRTRKRAVGWSGGGSGGCQELS